MSDKDSAKNVIDSYRKRRQNTTPFLIGGAAIVLIAVGIVVLVLWLTGSSGPSATTTPTITNTPTASATPTASGPFVYVVVEGDTLDSIAAQFNVNVLVLMALNNMTDSLIRVGDELLIPNPDLALDTPTPIPTGWRGDIEYRVAVGDTLELIAIQFNSTVESIMEENELENANEIFVGQILIIRVNIATPVPTSTPRPTILTPSPTP